MTVVRAEIRSGVYHDSIILMQLQAALAKLPGVRDAAVVMGTKQNVAMLAASGLHPRSAGIVSGHLGPDDLVIVVEAEDDGAAERALAQIDELISGRRAGEAVKFQPRSLESAIRRLPSARWALVSVPGRFATSVARDALAKGLHVFMYSDNVDLTDEVSLKHEATSRGLLLMGPDCGTAIVNGTGFGFANRVRRGAIGLIGASGTGLQAISCRIHALGAGISHAFGTGGRDLHAEVGAITALQAMRLLGDDPETEVIVLISKPPDPAVAESLVSAAAETGKPTVVHFLGHRPPEGAEGPSSMRFAASLGECAELAVRLADGTGPLRTGPRSVRGVAPDDGRPGHPPEGRRYVRGLFAGGTLAFEAARAAGSLLTPVYSNISLEGIGSLEDPTRSRAHTILDLGADEFTVGRLHPMMDNELRLRRLARETADPETGVVLLDLVLGDGAHPDPAADFAPAIEAARRDTDIEFVTIVIGTEDDPQNLETQIDRLEEAGARVFSDTVHAVRYAALRLGSGSEPLVGSEPLTTVGSALHPSLAEPMGAPPSTAARSGTDAASAEVDPDILRTPVAAINVGVRVFCDSLLDQGAAAVHVEWRPPAGGDENLMSILDRLK